MLDGAPWSWFETRVVGLRWDDAWPQWRRGRPPVPVEGAARDAAFRSL